ncbi:MAG: uncharacterized protein JWO86_4316 [Myxococcaceae bacterium]|jgi:hypothetical protein|nr:uncharacterized protein [Myxococcaceae bacterium]
MTHFRSRLRNTLLSVVLVMGVAIPAAAHAAREREALLRADREIAAVTSALEPIAAAAGSEQRVTLNGAPLFFRKTTEQGTLDEVMARVAKECASGTEASAFGISKNLDDGVNKPIALERVVSQESEAGVRASLCVFANDDGASSEELRRVRYTLAHRRDDGSIAVTTVVNASSTPLHELFPAEGDAPGSDLEGVARPEQSRRTMTAIVGRGEHAVRVYESTLDVEASAGSYDRQMTALGYDTTGSLDDARMYRKDDRSYVASFRATTGGSTVALLPFGSRPSM